MRTLTLVAALAALLAGCSCNASPPGSAGQPDTSAVVVEPDLTPLPVQPDLQLVQLDATLPALDLATSCGAAGQHCCGVTCTSNLTCAYFSDCTPVNSVCMRDQDLQAGIGLGVLCIKQNACRPCQCQGVGALCRTSADCCSACGYLDQNDADQHILRCLP